MDDHQSDKLLHKVEREGSTIGHTIPETLTIDGVEFNLSEFIFEVQDTGRVPVDDFESLQAAKQTLRQARNQRIETIEEGEISYELGCKLVEEIIGIDRALNFLESLGEDVDLERKSQLKEAERTKKWRSFVESIKSD